MEIWKPIKRFDNVIEASNFGRVRRVDVFVNARGGKKRLVKGRVLSFRRHPWGYAYYQFSVNGKIYYDFGHRLVLEAFVGEAPPGHYGLHFDNNPQNNAIENLRWGSPTENCADKLMHGTQKTGEQIWWSKLKEKEVVDMRVRRADGESLELIAKTYGLTDVYVWHICSGKKWPNAGGPLTFAKRVVRLLSEEEKLNVVVDRKSGLTIAKLSEKYQVSRTQIHNLVRNI